MNPERLKRDCEAVRDELLQLSCGDVGVASPGLQSHLATCSVCRAALEDSRSMIRDLEAALRPEPWPERLTAEIHDRLAARTGGRPMLWTWSRRAVGTAVAAGLLAALLLPARTPAPDATSRLEHGITLSDDDAAEIAWACAVFDWESPVGASIEYLGERIDDVAGAIRRDPDARTVLPWEPDDDWDIPAAEADTSGPGQRVGVPLLSSSARFLAITPTLLKSGGTWSRLFVTGAGQ